MMYAQTLSWDTWDADIIRWFNSGFNGATSQEAGNFVLMICSLLLTVILTGALGFEREYRGHHAGLRTHVLVGVGSCLIMMISIYGFTPWDEAFVTGAATGSGAPAARDPTRLAAQVVSGIGFLGAGAIIQNGVGVKGLTTATTLWVAMALGLACGSGNFLLGAMTAVVALFVLIMLHSVDRWIARRDPIVVMVVENNKPALKEIMTIAERYGVTIKETYSELLTNQSGTPIRMNIRCSHENPASIAAFVEELRNSIKPMEIHLAVSEK